MVEVTPPPALTLENWGLLPYTEALERQKKYVNRRISGEIGDTLIMTEHPPVYTIGVRKDATANLLWTAQQLRASGVDVAETNRGGDITCHSPGQLVGYPILNLRDRFDLHAYLRQLEEVLIRVLKKYDLTGQRRDGLTGIWIGTRKIVAIGIAVRRWVSYHGFALNVNNDLTLFRGIVPCGIDASSGTVTSLAAELGMEQDMETVRHNTILAFGEVFGQKTETPAT